MAIYMEKHISTSKKRLIEKKAHAGTEEEEQNIDFHDDLFAGVCDLWLDSCKSICKESTITKYSNMLNHYIKPYIGNTSLSTIKTHTITDMLFELSCYGGKKSDGLSVKTMSDIISVLRRIQTEYEISKTKVVITLPKSFCSVRIIPIQDIIIEYVVRFENVAFAVQIFMLCAIPLLRDVWKQGLM